MAVSIHNSSLALDEIQVSNSDLVDLHLVRHLSIRNASTESQPACQVVKVSGTITVSF